MTKLDAVAIAIYEADPEKWRAGIAIGNVRPETIPRYRAMARAAIEALREPTDAMVGAMWREIDEWGTGIPNSIAGPVYDAAIDAALAEPVIAPDSPER